ncbi:MAG: class I SAM-dependent methyltransferase [Polyangiaceae bacterium]
MMRFQTAYDGEPPPWDIGRPQPAFVALADKLGEQLRGPILDCGCGTGENTMLFAERGAKVLGVDVVARAIELAKAKAAERGSSAEFQVGNALELASLGRSFSTIIDCAVFHVFDDADRGRYLQSLASVLEPGGYYYMLVFSDRESAEWGGPRRVSQAEIRAAFQEGWQIHSIEEARVDTLLHPTGSGHGWFSTIQRLTK